MIFNFTQVTPLIIKLSRRALACLFISRHKVRKGVTADQHYQGNPAGGMFGQLVSKEVTRRP